MIDKIAKKFLEDKYLSSDDVESIIDSIEKDDNYDWRDLSDSNNNLGDVRITGQKYHTLVERLTNSIDACIEKKALIYPEIEKFKNPSQVKSFLEDKKDPITNKDIIIGIYPHNKKTNFYFQDRGIGISNDNMPYSILKISGSNLNKKEKII